MVLGKGEFQLKRKKWEGATYPRQVWLAKLGEEFGEVSEASLDMWHVEEELQCFAQRPDEYDGRKLFRNAERTTAHMIEELEHLEFIARNFRLQLEEGR